DDLVRLDPGHHGTQLRAHFLDLVFAGDATACLQGRGAGLVFQDEVAGELAVLDVGQYALHFRLGFFGNDARAGDVVAVLGGVGDGVAHVGDAALIHQVDDELQLVQALEVGHFRRVA